MKVSLEYSSAIVSDDMHYVHGNQNYYEHDIQVPYKVSVTSTTFYTREELWSCLCFTITSNIACGRNVQHNTKK